MIGHHTLVVLVVTIAFVAAKLPMSFRYATDGPQLVEKLADEPAINYRLPNNTRPISYDVHLTTNIHTQTDFNFSGVVAIRFVVVTASRLVTLHQRQLTIGTATLTSLSTSQPIALNPFEYNSVSELLTFRLTTGSLTINNEYILTINFKGIHRTGTDIKGLYRSSYLADDGTRR